jgi:hypothetical protein
MSKGSQQRVPALFGALGFILFSACAALDAVAGPNAEEVLADLPISDSARSKIMAGEITQWTTMESSDREIVIGKVLLVRDKKPDEVVEIFRHAIGFKIDPDVSAFGKIEGPGTMSDFAEVKLGPGAETEARFYLESTPGDGFNLSSQEIAAFEALNVEGELSAGTVASVEQQLRSMLLARYQAYRAQGLSGIDPYARDGGTELRPGDELTQAITVEKILAKYAPSFQKTLLKYPENKPAGLEEWFYWLSLELDSRPAFILSHRLAIQSGDSFMISDRHFYVSREYNVLQTVGGLLPTTEGTLVLYVYRLSTDQVTGFASSVKHKAARKVVGEPLEQLLENLRTAVEKE